MAGGIVGALIGLVALVLLFVFIRRRRQNNALYMSSRPDLEKMPRHGGPVFSMISPSGPPSIIVDAPPMAQVAPGPSYHVHKKPAPSLTEQDMAAIMAGPALYGIDAADKPTSSTASMAFDKDTFAQSLEQNSSWAAATNPFRDPVNPFADPAAPTTRVSQMPEIPRHLRMSTTSSALQDGNLSPRSTIYQDGFAM
ncbi:hypothetical protein C8F01DRAFT_1107479 [Mycena amicta]|nr:hypothetical protein C8F01DRAFT_1107479 [Mycena amicta]